MKKVALILIVLASMAYGFHEFKVPKKVYKKVTIEYFSNDSLKTQPDSTVVIYYDRRIVIDSCGYWIIKSSAGYHNVEGLKSGVTYIEIYREVIKGCGNVIKVSTIDWEALEMVIDSVANRAYNNVWFNKIRDSLRIESNK